MVWRGPLVESLPRLAALDSNRNCSIADRMSKANCETLFAWNWRFERRETRQVQEIQWLCERVSLGTEKDGGCRNLIAKVSTQWHLYVTRWTTWVLVGVATILNGTKWCRWRLGYIIGGSVLIVYRRKSISFKKRDATGNEMCSFLQGPTWNEG